MRRILIYGDVDLNVIDGSSVWLVNLARLLSQEQDIYVDILLKKRIRRDMLVRQIKENYRIRLLYAKEYIDSICEVDEHNAAKVIGRVDALGCYSCIIVRGIKVVKHLLDQPYVDRLVPYLTDFCHDEKKISEQQVRFLSELYEKVRLYLVQTDAMKEYFPHGRIQISGSVFQIISFPVPTHQFQPIAPGQKLLPAHLCHCLDWNVFW